MTEQELKNLSRRDLLEMLIEQSKEVQELRAKLAQTESLLADKTVMLEQMEKMNKTAAEINAALSILQSNHGIYQNKKHSKTKNKSQDNPQTKYLQQEISRINAEKTRLKELRELKTNQNNPTNPNEQQNESKTEIDLKVEDDGDNGRKEIAST